MDVWPTGTPQKVSEKKTNKHPTPPTNSPGKFLKKREHSKGLVLGLATLAACFYQSQPSSELVHCMFFFFRQKKPSPADFCWSKKNLIWRTIGVTNPALKMGLLHQTQQFSSSKPKVRRPGGSKLSGVARGKDRSCGAKVSSRAMKALRRLGTKTTRSTWKKYVSRPLKGKAVNHHFSVSYVGFLESVAFCWKRWTCSWWESNFKLKIKHFKLKIQTVWRAFCCFFFKSKGLGMNHFDFVSSTKLQYLGESAIISQIYLCYWILLILDRYVS